MTRYGLCVTVSAALLTGTSGAARAEVDQPLAQTERVKPTPQAQVPIPRRRPAAASRQAPPDQSASPDQTGLPDQTAASVTPQPACDWFACAQYVIIGIGF
jgi:hypothetical protein